MAFCLTFLFAVRGYRGDDFQFHFLSWMSLKQAWLQGEFSPGWDGLANYTLGDPRFCFYPPISLWLGTLLCVVLPPMLAPAAFVGLALVLAAICMMVASETLFGEKTKYSAALLYMASPYLLVAAITRFAIAELLVMAWLPLVVAYFVRAMGRSGWRPALLLGSLLALTWLTNLPASIALGYALFFAAVIVSIRRRTAWPLVRFLAAEAVALLASAFYLVPAFVEKKWISTDALLHQNYQDYFVFGPLSRIHRTRFELGLWVISCVEIAIVVGCLAGRSPKAKQHSRLLYVLAGVAFLFQLPVTALLWQYLPQLRYVQFPFRFLAILGVVLPLVVLSSAMKPWAVKTAAGLSVALALFPVAFYLRIAPSSPSTTANYLAALESGYPGTEEYTPAGGTLVLSPTMALSVSAVSDPGNQCSVSNLATGTRTRKIAVISESPCRVRFPIYFYPYWEAADEAGDKLVTSRDSSGMLLVDVPRGRHTVRVRFHPYSMLRLFSLTASFAVFLYFAVTLMRFLRKESKRSNTQFPSSLGTGTHQPDVPAAEALP